MDPRLGDRGGCRNVQSLRQPGPEVAQQALLLHALRPHLPEGAQSFTTVELKSNFLGTAREGTIVAKARAAHLGRTTQVWDVEVETGDEGRTLALFRCTQMILHPRA